MAKIFEENAYVKTISTKIKDVDHENNAIELEDEIFYAKSGGQPGDVGKIIIGEEKIEVKDTIKSNGLIKNIIEGKNILEVGIEIKAEVDWNKRYKHMRMHSALHVMCAAIPLGVTGGQIGYEKSRLDFNDPEKKIVKEELQEKINRIMQEDHGITFEYIDSKIL